MHIRVIALITLLLVVQGWCKPPKDIDDLEDYNDDAQAEENEDYSQTEDEDESPDAIKKPPQIISQPISKHVRAGATVTLPCLTENTDSFAVIWKKDDQFLYYGSNPMTNEPNRIERTANNSLVIHNVTMTDSSNNYICSITSRIPVTITHRLLVEPPNDRSPSMMMTTMTTTSMITTTTTSPQMVPTSLSGDIRVEPSSNINVVQGHSTKFYCYPKDHSSQMKWYHENVKLHNNSHTLIRGYEVIIINARRQDAGMYQCLAENGKKNPPISAINVTVYYAPEIETEHDIVHTGNGIESEITCIVHAHPHANVTWYKNQKELPKKGRISQKNNKLSYTLRIMRTTEQDFGNYTCQAKNELGQASRTITLTGAPSQAIIFGAAYMTNDNNDLVLKWHLESYSPIAQYKLKYHREGDEQWQEIEPSVKDGDGNQYIAEHVIVGLDAGNYEAVLEARNSFGWSPPSKPVTFKKENVEKVEAASVGGSAVSIRPFWAFPVSLLVVCAFRKL